MEELEGQEDWASARAAEVRGMVARGKSGGSKSNTRGDVRVPRTSGASAVKGGLVERGRDAAQAPGCSSSKYEDNERAGMEGTSEPTLEHMAGCYM